MGIVASFVDRRVGAELNERRVLVWYDPARAWQTWFQSALGEGPRGEEATAAQVTIGDRDAHLVISTGSHYEVLRACEPLLSGSELPRVLIYVPGEPYLEMLSPLRELECLGGEKEPYQRELTQVARQALQSAGLAESKIDELLNRDGLDFPLLDSISVGDGGESLLTPIFGSSREIDVFPSFLAEPVLRAKAVEKGLLPDIARLASEGLGLWLSGVAEGDDGAAMVHELARGLLVAEMRSDLDGREPMAISQIAGPSSAEQVGRVRAVCEKLRREYPEVYEERADTVERELGLADAEIDAEALGRIDTFRFEERRLLEACARRLAAGEAGRALSIVEGRLNEGSFWASVSRYPERHGAWEAARELARLALAVDEVAKALRKAPSTARGWVDSYTTSGGWHRVDQLFREACYRLSRLEDAPALAAGAERVFAGYDEVLERMAAGFVQALQQAGWQVEGIPRQEEVYVRYVAVESEPVAYVLADAMRFEMGADLARLLEAAGATGLKLAPALAVVPTITDMGMAALQPGADRAFSMAESPKGVTGAIRGKALVGSSARMEYAKGQIPGLVEMTVDKLLNDLSPKKREEALQGAKVVMIRSQEIDGAGENLPTSLARTVMGTVLETLRATVRCLSNAGIRKFVIAADHGHLFGQRRGDDMKIDPPEGGKEIDRHRRCWIGKGGSTPPGCVRLTASDLGYEGTDLELVVPKGTAVFKAGGDLAFHHGGLSLQELIIPVLTFELVGRTGPKKAPVDRVTLERVPTQITTRIFSVRVTPRQLDFVDPLQVRVKAISGDNRTVAQAISAYGDWDPTDRHVTFKDTNSVDVGLQLDDDTVSELRIIVVEVGTERTLKDTAPIPVEVIQ